MIPGYLDVNIFDHEVPQPDLVRDPLRYATGYSQIRGRNWFAISDSALRPRARRTLALRIVEGPLDARATAATENSLSKTEGAARAPHDTSKAKTTSYTTSLRGALKEEPGGVPIAVVEPIAAPGERQAALRQSEIGFNQPWA